MFRHLLNRLTDMPRLRQTRATASGACLALLFGCTPESRPPEDTKPVVIVSVLPQAYFVERVGGDLVDIEVMIPPGASPTTYEPTIPQLRSISRALLYLKVGHPNFPFEKAWLNKLIAENDSIKVIDGAAGLQWREGDPHIWLAPSQVRSVATNLAAALIEILPRQRERLESNLDRFVADIDAVDRELHAVLDGHRGKKFFVFHPAWGYFAEEYGLRQVAIEEHAKEPSPDQLAELIAEAKREKAPVIFVQPQFSKQGAELVAAEVGAEVVPIDPLARDWLANLKKVAEAFRKAFAQ